MERDDLMNSFSRREMISLAAGGALGGLMSAIAMPAVAETAIRSGSATDLAARPKVDLERKGAQLVLTGCDFAASAPLNAAASCALVIDGRVLQFGFGRGTMLNLSMAGIDPLRIDELYLMRPGIDFVAEYSQLVNASIVAGRRGELQVFGPPGTRALTQAAAGAVLDMARNRNEHLRGGSFAGLGRGGFKVTELAAGALGLEDVYRVTASRGGPGYGEVKSLVYRIDSKYGSVAFGTGVGASEAMERIARNVDILVHHFTLPDRRTGGDEIPGIEGMQCGAEPVSAPTLGGLASRAGAKILVPYCSPSPGVPGGETLSAPSTSQWSEAIARHFSGSVVLPGGSVILTLS